MFQQRIKELRLKQRLTQQQVAEKIGVTRPAYSAYEIGKREPDFETLKKLANIFDVSTDYLLGKSSNENDTSVTPPNTIAAHIDEDVTAEEMEDILNYIEFIKNKHRK